MPTITLNSGQLDYRVYTPVASPGTRTESDIGSAKPTALFVHGFLTDGTLWTEVAPRLASRGIASVVPDWPLGSHRRPWGDGELSPTSLAAAITELCDALDLERVILVGNDTGGAICQLALRPPSDRIDGLVLTNCDGFEVFPPNWFVPLFHVARYRLPTWFLLQNTRLRFIRHSPLAYGRLLNGPRPAQLTKHWVEPALHDPGIRHDINRFMRAYRGDELVDSGVWLGRFRRPARVVWGMRDRCFTPTLGRRIAAALPDATFVEVADTKTFVPLDAPDAVVDAVLRCIAAGAVSSNDTTGAASPHVDAS